MQQQQLNLDKNLSLEFTPQQLTIVITLLRKGSHEQVADIINSIERQVIKQLQPPTKMEKPNKPEQVQLQTEDINK